MVSPPARLTNARSTWGETDSRRKVTWPSANTTVHPPAWNENISSFAPQFIGFHGLEQVALDTDRWSFGG